MFDKFFGMVSNLLITRWQQTVIDDSTKSITLETKSPQGDIKIVVGNKAVCTVINDIKLIVPLDHHKMNIVNKLYLDEFHDAKN